MSRKDLIQQIQKNRGSKVITYFTSDRRFANANIAKDAVRPLYDHLLASGKVQKIDLFLYGRGGDISVPWRITSMVREFCDEFSILVPYKAHSAATLVALGADHIIMGKKAELSPIDPIFIKTSQNEIAGSLQEINVEDVNSFVSFVKDRAGIFEPLAVSQIVTLLVNNISPLALGSVNRQNSHIKLVARKSLTSRKEKMEEATIISIIDALCEKIYSHGHGIGRKEAHDIGLPVISPDVDLEKLLWDLYLDYERLFNLNDPVDPVLLLQQTEETTIDNVPMAAIESETKSHVFKSKIEFKKKRQIPQNAQINLNISVNLPPTIKPEQIPQDAQQILQQMTGQINQTLRQQVQQEIVKQAPEIGLISRQFGSRWEVSEGVY